MPTKGINSELLLPQLREILSPLDRWDHQCHAASIELVRGLDINSRVARGMCRGVGGQHSWVVIGNDCYANDASIIDPTLWSYVDDVDDIWLGSYKDGLHTPHGKGSIWEWGRPDVPAPGAEVIELTPRQPWSREAEDFLELLGPLDSLGWRHLAHAPVEAWPAGEIIDAMYEHPELRAWVPIDIVGMITDRNPHGIYLRDSDV